MTLVFPDQGEAYGLELLVSKASGQDLVLRLLANDVTDGLTPEQVEALTVADFTEAAFTGYSAVTLTGANWSTSQGDPSEVTYAQQTFTSTGDQTSPETIYGYYYTRATGGELVAFEYFDDDYPTSRNPVVIEFEDDTIRITPRITAADTQDS